MLNELEDIKVFHSSGNSGYCGLELHNQTLKKVRMDASRYHPVILIVGAAKVGKKALAARLLLRPASELVLPALWTIDTKYYTAQTSLVLRSSSSAGNGIEQVLARKMICACAQCHQCHTAPPKQAN